ncbi:hypothetical protein H072_60 [Dactylellina haptotyla CBS 200.50]|uniref:Uncharacterized protein n=1 Tax=Dactylellina haptotyla (strain CBS 200.50) TaxID=1284197 RepID=S8AY85_DACHA|nr:hypothetical protein H072_60 [Dactylellina haptotyla CBS 200.50]
MKFFSSSVLAFGLMATSFVSAVAIPAKAAPVEKRGLSIVAAISIVETLTIDVKVATGSINSTLAGLPDVPSIVESTAASVSINAAIGKITVLIQAAIAEINGFAVVKRDAVVATRQSATPADLASVVVGLLLEVSGTLNGVLSILGLKSILAGTLGGLVASLSGLLLALVPVVDNLLLLVRNLLDGLLIGLSAALAGLLL